MFVACKKDDSDKPTHIGLWKGKYGGVSAYPTSTWYMLFRDNGTVRVFDGSDTTTATKAEGTYIFTGTAVNTTYTYPPSTKYSTTATINARLTFQEGTYGSGTNTSGSGRFIMVKE